VCLGVGRLGGSRETETGIGGSRLPLHISVFFDHALGLGLEDVV